MLATDYSMRVRFSHAREFKLPTKRRQLSWRERQLLLLTGAPMAVVPVLVFVPLMVLAVSPIFARVRLGAILLLVALTVMAVWGVVRLVRCMRRALDLITAMALGALLVLLVAVVYDAVLFFAVLQRDL